jgi:hypothetical protein
VNTLKLGKQPAAQRSEDFELARYLSVATGPTAPPRFGFDSFIAINGWGMLGNDEVGDCVWASFAHEHMVYTGGNRRAATMARFTTVDVLDDYSAATGYDPHDPSTDQGTIMSEAMAYRRHAGIVDAADRRHQVGAYAALRPRDWDQLVQAIYVFEAVSIGVEFPDSAFQQFDQGAPWDVVAGARIVGGHCITGVGRSSADRVEIVSWGRRLPLTRAFYQAYADEAYAVITPDQLAAGGDSLRGFDMARLEEDLAAL